MHMLMWLVHLMPWDLLIVANTGSGLGGILDNITAELKDILNALAVLGLFLYFMSIAVRPWAPDWEARNRGWIGALCFGLILVGIAPDLVDWFMGLGEGSD